MSKYCHEKKNDSGQIGCISLPGILKCELLESEVWRKVKTDPYKRALNIWNLFRGDDNIVNKSLWWAFKAVHMPYIKTTKSLFMQVGLDKSRIQKQFRNIQRGVEWLIKDLNNTPIVPFLRLPTSLLQAAAFAYVTVILGIWNSSNSCSLEWRTVIFSRHSFMFFSFHWWEYHQTDKKPHNCAGILWLLSVFYKLVWRYYDSEYNCESYRSWKDLYRSLDSNLTKLLIYTEETATIGFNWLLQSCIYSIRNSSDA